MPMQGLKVTKVRSEQSFGPQGRVLEHIAVDFTVGDHGPFTERFTKDEFNGGAVNQRLMQFANNLAAISGIST